MASASSSQIQLVKGYVADYAIPLMASILTITQTLNTDPDPKWNIAESVGTRGDTYTKKKPTRFQNKQSLGFDAATEGAFNEQFFTITVDQERSVPYARDDNQRALVPEDLLTSNAIGSINNLCNEIEQFNGNQVAVGGYRFHGSPIVQAGQMQSPGELTEAVSRFRSFGGQGHISFGIPTVASFQTVDSSFQQFVPNRNDDMALAGEIGKLRGVANTMFYTSDQLPLHISGTAASDAAGVNAGVGYVIVSVTPTAPSTTSAAGSTVIELSGGFDGDTIIVNDLIDIGVLNTANPLLFLTYTGYVASSAFVQARVTVGDTFSGGNATITVEPALIFDATNEDTARNLNRDIDLANDKVRIVQSHRAGAVYHDQYVAFACPRLGDTRPFPSASVYKKELGIALRAYEGYSVETATYFNVHDVIFGGGTAPEGLARIIYPI